MEQWLQDYCDAFEDANGFTCSLVPVEDDNPVKHWTIMVGPVTGIKSYTKADILAMTQSLIKRIKM